MQNLRISDLSLVGLLQQCWFSPYIELGVKAKQPDFCFLCVGNNFTRLVVCSDVIFWALVMLLCYFWTENSLFLNTIDIQCSSNCAIINVNILHGLKALQGLRKTTWVFVFFSELGIIYCSGEFARMGIPGKNLQLSWIITLSDPPLSYGHVLSVMGHNKLQCFKQKSVFLLLIFIQFSSKSQTLTLSLNTDILRKQLIYNCLKGSKGVKFAVTAYLIG